MKRGAVGTFVLAVGGVLAAGCGGLFVPQPAPLFTVPLSIEGEDVGPAIIDTGGAYEIILRETFGLEVIGEIDVLAFGGVEQLQVTRGFEYVAGGVAAQAASALIGVSTCDCNGIDFQFFRKHHSTLAMDFRTLGASFAEPVPDGAILISFGEPPPTLPNFDSSFIEVEAAVGGQRRPLTALLDTGTNHTLLRRGLFQAPPLTLGTERMEVTVRHESLGTLALNARLFDTPGLPDIILGTDAMRAWGDRWYFTYYDVGGYVAVVPGGEGGESEPASVVKQ